MTELPDVNSDAEPAGSTAEGADSVSVEGAEPTTKKTPDERKELLARTVQNQIAQGSRVESQSDYQAVLVRGHRPNNTLHLILTIVTGGIWGLFVWAPIAIFGGEKRMVATVDEYGNASVQKM